MNELRFRNEKLLIVSMFAHEQLTIKTSLWLTRIVLDLIGPHTVNERTYNLSHESNLRVHFENVNGL